MQTPRFVVLLSCRNIHLRTPTTHSGSFQTSFPDTYTIARNILGEMPPSGQEAHKAAQHEQIGAGGLFARSEIGRLDVPGTLRHRIAEAVERTAISRGLSLRAIDWQIDMAAGMIEGKDQLCVTKTADGKTYCFLVACMAEPNKCILVLSPLVSLMHDQVCAGRNEFIQEYKLCFSILTGP
ncbi:MAG: hypothetical protein JWR35_3665 [Marmoricola sp.]|nr:hypothetical protein [Marmoricola sp.]